MSDHASSERTSNRDAVESMLERELPRLHAFMRLRASHVLRSRESVSDLAQSVCREVLSDSNRFKPASGEAGFRSWLFTTAVRKLADRDQFWKAHKRDHRREQGPDDSLEHVAEQYRSLLTPSRVASVREDVARVEAAFDRLPQNYREAISLARFGRMSHAEIAGLTGSNPVATRALLHRAMARLAEELDESPLT